MPSKYGGLIGIGKDVFGAGASVAKAAWPVAKLGATTHLGRMATGSLVGGAMGAAAGDPHSSIESRLVHTMQGALAGAGVALGFNAATGKMGRRALWGATKSGAKGSVGLGKRMAVGAGQRIYNYGKPRLDAFTAKGLTGRQRLDILGSTVIGDLGKAKNTLMPYAVAGGGMLLGANAVSNMQDNARKRRLRDFQMSASGDLTMGMHRGRHG